MTICMTNEKLKEITDKTSDVILNGMYILEEGTNDEKYELLSLIASLHNELYKAVTGKYYDYMFHWANRWGGDDIDDSMFKEVEE